MRFGYAKADAAKTTTEISKSIKMFIFLFKLHG